MLARRRKGWAGLIVGGACFILPSMLLVLVLSWAYVSYGTTDAGAGMLFGIKPVVVAIIENAVVGLARTPSNVGFSQWSPARACCGISSA